MAATNCFSIAQSLIAAYALPIYQSGVPRPERFDDWSDQLRHALSVYDISFLKLIEAILIFNKKESHEISQYKYYI